MNSGERRGERGQGERPAAGAAGGNNAFGFSREPDPKKREALVKAALRRHNEQVLNIPLHRQVIPWAARDNVTVVHRADNWLEWSWVNVGK